MSIVKEKKKELIAQYQKHKKDSGSTEVQVSLLTERINDLTKHLNNSPKDYQSRRGLLMLVGKRKRLLKYLENIDIEASRRIVDKLGIRN